MATLKDISLLANVSVSTVSKALNGSSEISDETRLEVVQIANSLNYKVKEKKVVPSIKKTIAIVCPALNSNYYMQLLNCVNEYIISKGFYSLLGVSFFSPSKERDLLKEFVKKKVDGIIFITENENIDELFQDFNAKHTPIVIISNAISNTDVPGYDVIKTDIAQGIEFLMQHLVELGHTQIGYIGDTVSEPRYQIYSSLLKKYGLQEHEEFVITTSERYEEAGYHSMQKLLKSANLPTAIFAAYDDIAVGIMKAASENNLRIPDDISIVGFDDIFVAHYLTTGLTTVANPIRELASTSSTILMHKIKHPGQVTAQYVVFKPHLVVRNSTSRVESK